MKNIFIILISFLFSTAAFCQKKSKKEDYYNKGVELFGNEDYKNADSLFTLAITLNKRDKDAYYNRGIVRKKMGDESGFIYDMLHAIELHDSVANITFWKHKRMPDTLLSYSNKTTIQLANNSATMKFLSSQLDTCWTSYFVKEKGLQLLYWITKNDTIYTYSAEMPTDSITGDVYKVVRKTIRYPQNAKENGIQGTVYIAMFIDKDGKASKTQIYKGVKGGEDLEAEALRIVMSFDKWSPLKVNGKPVKSLVILPIRFKLQ